MNFDQNIKMQQKSSKYMHFDKIHQIHENVIKIHQNSWILIKIIKKMEGLVGPERSFEGFGSFDKIS